MSRSPSRSPNRARDVAAVLAELKSLGSKSTRDGLARFAIPSERAFGVATNAVQQVAKRLGTDHALALALWDSGWLEARTAACYVADPALVTPALMDRWADDFDNWGTCDTACFVLFDKTPHAFAKVAQWAKRKEEFVKRAAFALLASVALHDKTTGDAPFVKCLPLIERAANDERNFVKKGVSWALRSTGARSRALLDASLALAARLARSDDAAERWVGKDATKDLARPLVAKRAAAREKKRS